MHLVLSCPLRFRITPASLMARPSNYTSFCSYIWYAQLLLLFSHKTKHGNETELAFVRWFEETQRPSHAINLKLRALTWATVSAPHPIRGKVPQTDVLQLDAIIGPCFVQQDPINNGIFYFNHWVGNTANEGM